MKINYSFYLFLILSIFIFQLPIFNASAQEIKGSTPPGSVNISKDPPKPADLVFVANTLQFADSDNNKMIDADETCYIRFTLQNAGIGDGLQIKAVLKEASGLQGLEFSQYTALGTLKAGQTMQVEILLNAKHSIVSGTAKFSITIEELNGFNSETALIEVRSREFQPPQLTVVEYTVTCSDGSKTIQYNRPFDLTVLIQNKGTGKATDVRVNVQYPESIFMGDGTASANIGVLETGASKIMNYSFTIPRAYQGTAIPLKLQLTESWGKYGTSKDINLELNQQVSENKLVVEGVNITPNNIPEVSLSSDVDKNIPVAETKNQHIYALIIGNEDYSSKQTGLSSEVNVDYAKNDADIFSKYVQSTLGAESEKVKYLPDATAAQMKQGINWLIDNAKRDNGNAEIIFYYSGHGLPDDSTKDAYLIPVDVSGTNVRDGIKLDGVIANIAAVPSKHATLFIDACFSGGARNQGLLAMKGVKFPARANYLQGKLVMFSSSTGEESSGVWRDKQHGFFTYFLLKKLQETKGDVSFLDLGTYLQTKVLDQTLLISKKQTPQVLFSKEVESEWEEWRMK
jgi:hypothetical protein